MGRARGPLVVVALHFSSPALIGIGAGVLLSGGKLPEETFQSPEADCCCPQVTGLRKPGKGRGFGPKCIWDPSAHWSV